MGRLVERSFLKEVDRDWGLWQEDTGPWGEMPVKLSPLCPYTPRDRPCEQNFHRAAEQNSWNSLVIEGPPESGGLKEEAEGFRKEAETPSRPVGAWAGARASGLAEEGRVWGDSSSQGELPRQGRA